MALSGIYCCMGMSHALYFTACPVGQQAAASPVHLREAARALAAQRVDAWLRAVAALPPQPSVPAQTNVQACGNSRPAEAAATAGQQGGPPSVCDWPKAAQAAAGDSGFGSPTVCDLQAASTLALLTAEALGAAPDSESDSEADSSSGSSAIDEGSSPEDAAPQPEAPADGCPPDSRATHANGRPVAVHNWCVSPPPEDLGLQHPLTRVLADLAPGVTHWRGKMCYTSTLQLHPLSQH